MSVPIAERLAVDALVPRRRRAAVLLLRDAQRQPPASAERAARAVRVFNAGRPEEALDLLGGFHRAGEGLAACEAWPVAGQARRISR